MAAARAVVAATAPAARTVPDDGAGDVAMSKATMRMTRVPQKVLTSTTSSRTSNGSIWPTTHENQNRD